MSFLIKAVLCMLICVVTITLANFYPDYKVLLMITGVVSFAIFALTVAHEFTIDL